MRLRPPLLAWLSLSLLGAANLSACADSPARQAEAEPSAATVSTVNAVPPSGSEAAGTRPQAAAPATAQPAASDPTAATTSADLAAGQQRYAAHCAGCHGEVGEGGFGPALAAAAAWSPPAFRQAVRAGQVAQRELLSSMPRFTTDVLPEAALQYIQAYLRSLD